MDASFTVADVKAAISARQGAYSHCFGLLAVIALFTSSPARAGVCCAEQRIVFNGKQLEDESLLSLCGVEEESTLYSLGSLQGGMAKKRKKKTYTKPKKQKHKCKKARSGLNS